MNEFEKKIMVKSKASGNGAPVDDFESPQVCMALNVLAPLILLAGVAVMVFADEPLGNLSQGVAAFVSAVMVVALSQLIELAARAAHYARRLVEQHGEMLAAVKALIARVG